MSAPVFTDRIVLCLECGGSGVRMGASFNDLECFDCAGAGEWNATCAVCDLCAPLNDDGECEDCVGSAEVEAPADERGNWHRVWVA